jgi:hypothetical protein
VKCDVEFILSEAKGSATPSLVGEKGGEFIKLAREQICRKRKIDRAVNFALSSLLEGRVAPQGSLQISPSLVRDKGGDLLSSLAGKFAGSVRADLALRLAPESDKSLTEVPANFLLRSSMMKVRFIKLPARRAVWWGSQAG